MDLVCCEKLVEMDINLMKKKVAEYAIDQYVESGMVLGLGSGSTISYGIDCLGLKLKEKQLDRIACVPTSKNTFNRMKEWEIVATTLDHFSFLDLVIDGADQVDSQLNLIKGRGMALLREKMVAQCAKRLVIIVDETKILSPHLGLCGPIPVEIVKFGAQHIMRQLLGLPSFEGLNVTASFRAIPGGTSLAETDNGNYIVDLHFVGPLVDPVTVARDINSVVGVVEHGLFLGMNPTVLVSHTNGKIEVLTPSTTS